MSRFRLRAVLADSTIRREFEIDGTLRLRDLHDALQIMFGWRESHLHAFTDTDPDSRGPRGRRWVPSYGLDGDDTGLPEDDFWVADVFGAIDTLWYEYDFGDGWTVRIDAAEQRTEEPLLASVVLLDGTGRGPYEDSGGMHGYLEKLEIAADPQHPEHREISHWIRATVGPWAGTAPDAFDLVGIQSELNLRFNPEASGYSPSDMSGLVKVDEHRRPGDVGDASPIVALASELPPPLRSELRRHLHATGVLEPTDIDDETAARIVAPFAWLMDAVGPDGLSLTSAGWMPPATVLDGMTRLGWLDDWIGKGNREDLTPPIAVLRETAQRIGLVRVQKGRMLLSAAAKNALGDPHKQLRLIAGGLFRKLSDAETDAATLLLLAIADGTPPDKRWEAIAYGLEACGWRSATGYAFSARDIDHATFHAQQVIEQLGPESHRERRRRTKEGQENPDIIAFAREALR